jgi:hypothetical protein
MLHIPFSQTLTTIRVDQLDVFGPQVTDDLSRILLVSRANLEFCSVCAHLAAREAAHRDDHVGVTRRRCVWCRSGLFGR